MRRTFIVTALVAVASLIVAGVAVAQEGDDVAPEHADRPFPLLTASGDGVATLDVQRGGVRLYVVGDVTIDGPADLDVVIESWEGAQPAMADGQTSIELTGFSGSVFVKGTDFTAEIDGHMSLHGHGKGTVTLDGVGLWKTRADKGVWPATLGLDD